jgi:DNA-binding XRE family transcriptional regulator
LNVRNQPPEQLITLGDHLLRRRLVLKLLQRQVAEQLGADKASIANWERDRSKPGVGYMPAILRFLGYNPFPLKEDWAARLVQCRTVLGLAQKKSAHRMGVDEYAGEVGAGRAGADGRLRGPHRTSPTDRRSGLRTVIRAACIILAGISCPRFSCLSREYSALVMWTNSATGAPLGGSSTDALPKF